jgi:hypothetical protein
MRMAPQCRNIYENNSCYKFILLLVFVVYLLRVFGNRMMRRIFGPKKNEVKGEWTKLHNEEINGLYSSPNIVR